MKFEEKQNLEFKMVSTNFNFVVSLVKYHRVLVLISFLKLPVMLTTAGLIFHSLYFKVLGSYIALEMMSSIAYVCFVPNVNMPFLAGLLTIGLIFN